MNFETILKVVQSILTVPPGPGITVNEIDIDPELLPVWGPDLADVLAWPTAEYGPNPGI